MARYLALEWDAREVRAAVAKTRGAEMSVEHAFAVTLPNGQEGDPDEAAEQIDIGQILTQALEERGLTKIDTIVGVGRSNIELRLLQLPAAPPEELPDMVRFQAMRQFAAIGEDWPLDFTEVAATGEDDSMNVLAASIAPDLVAQIKSTCQTAELEPQKLVLRPFAAASLLRRRGGAGDGECRLLVDLLADEADVTVLADGQVAFMRTVRLPTSDQAAVVARAMLGEIRRTIAAAQNQLGGRRVDHVSVFGSGEEHGLLKEEVETKLSLDVTLFDPFDQVHVSSDLRSNLPDHHGRFAPLVGDVG